MAKEEQPSILSTREERRALAVFALISAAALVWLALPVASGLFLGTLVAFSLQPFYEWLRARTGRRALAAIVIAAASGVAILVFLSALVYFIIARGIIVSNDVAAAFGPEGVLRKLFDNLALLSNKLRLAEPIDVSSRVREAAAWIASQLTAWAAALAGAMFSGLLMLFFMVMTVFFVLRHWAQLVRRIERILPIHPAHTHAVLAEFQLVGKHVFLGTILTGVTQGLLAGLGFSLGSVPEPVLLGAITAVCSLLPVVGTLVVWLPVSIVLIATGHAGRGIFELVWGVLVVVGVSDYVIRPKLVGVNEGGPTLITFIALFGGVEVFGLLGLVVGPVIASIALAFLRTYEREVGSVPRDGAPPPSLPGSAL